MEIHYTIGLKDEAEKYAQLLGYNFQSSKWYEKTYILFDRNYELNKNRKKEKKVIERELESVNKKDKFQNISDKLEEIGVGETSLIYQNLDNVSTKELRQLMDETKTKVKSAIIVLSGHQDNKIMIIVGITEDVLGKFSANDIIKIIAKFSDIKGGGRDDMAQAGGSQLGKKSEIIDAISKYIGSS
mgnify:CR=1 FL=1